MLDRSREFCLVESRIVEHNNVAQALLKSSETMDSIVRFASICRQAISSGCTVFFMGNGGSAADSQHLAAELVGRFQKERPGLASIALTTDTSILTAVGNDYGFEQIFSRQIEALVRPGDIVVGLSTSGNSPNVLRAVEVAKNKGVKTVGLTGRDGGILSQICDVSINIPGQVTARAQEMHILIGHVVCELIESDVNF